MSHPAEEWGKLIERAEKAETEREGALKLIAWQDTEIEELKSEVERLRDYIYKIEYLASKSRTQQKEGSDG